ncbi:MAG: alpha/beta hydrolase [Clostridiales bacterium]|nr:alpha/beta hydrolase [Clostridiales bacterium]
MGKMMTGIGILLGTLAAAQAGGTAYFYRRTMKRSHAKTERTMKMSGTDWNQYFPVIEQKKAFMLSKPHSDVWIESDDHLKLHGVYFPALQDNETQANKLVICFHGYTSQCMSDFIGLSNYYLNHGFQMLLVDARAHGQSEGEYVGFGCKDRFDALKWIRWAIQQAGKDCQILLHGISMGGATVLMTSGCPLPSQVKGIISDCAFTSAKEVFTHVLHSMYHLPAFPMIDIADKINKKKAGYGLDEGNAAREVRRAKVPILLIHGDRDTFVPCPMCEEIYKNCGSPATKLIIPGAGHAESYYKDTAAYEQAMDAFIGGIIK